MSTDYGAVLSERLRQQIELEVISSEARRKLTRLLRASVRGEHGIVRMNLIVNLANTVMNRPIYTLDYNEEIEPGEYAWHRGELESIMRCPGSSQLIEILADLITEGSLVMAQVNSILASDRCGIRFVSIRGEVEVEVQVIDTPDLEEGATLDEHANIRLLFDRMDRAMLDEDWSLVLHSGASIFETLAKLVIGLSTVQNKTLGAIFEAYRKRSRLAAPLLETIDQIYQRRNVQPLAGPK
jgi:hypothetical protein